MPGEQPYEHPYVPLLHYLDQQLAALHHELDTRVTGLHEEINGREALMQAEIDRRISAVTHTADDRADALDKRLEAMNEFRASLSDQRSRMVTTDVFTTTIEAIKEAREIALTAATSRIEALEKAMAGQRGRQAQTTTIISIAGVVIALASVVVLIIIHLNG